MRGGGGGGGGGGGEEGDLTRLDRSYHCDIHLQPLRLQNGTYYYKCCFVTPGVKTRKGRGSQGM